MKYRSIAHMKLLVHIMQTRGYVDRGWCIWENYIMNLNTLKQYKAI